jgi:hypothetical protein
MAEKAWELSGQYMESCNCDYLCPCIYTNPQARRRMSIATPSWPIASIAAGTAPFHWTA